MSFEVAVGIDNPFPPFFGLLKLFYVHRVNLEIFLDSVNIFAISQLAA